LPKLAPPKLDWRHNFIAFEPASILMHGLAVNGMQQQGSLRNFTHEEKMKLTLEYL
jgi:hypothetical protein